MIENGVSSALKESFANLGAVLEESKTGIGVAVQSSVAVSSKAVNSKAILDRDVSVSDGSGSKYHARCKSQGHRCSSIRAPVGSRHS